MRLFQMAGTYPTYRKRLCDLYRGCGGFREMRAAFLGDGYGGSHLLLPVAEGREEAFFTSWDDRMLQEAWAREQGMPRSAGLGAILLAQIEAHRTEVLYSTDPTRYGGDFLKQLPGCVKHKLCWRAAPAPRGLDLTGFDLLVCNFPSILASYRQAGLRAAYFAPAHDPIQDDYAGNQDRPIDVLFVGGYSRHHRARAQVLEAVAALCGRHRVVFALDRSRLNRLAEGPIGWLLPLGGHRRPRAIREVSQPPLFGRPFYEAISRAKIILNGAVDMAGADRGNVRCFETLGGGALMVSDAGNYPEGFTDQETMITYGGPGEAVTRIEACLADWGRYAPMARAGLDMVRARYARANQWQRFQALVSGL